MKKGLVIQSKIKALYDIFLNKQFILFVIIGCINTLSTTVFSTIYTSVLNSIQAFIVGYLTGIIISYTLNTTFTFKQKFNVVSLLKFSISTIPNFIIQMIIVYIGIAILHLPNIVCYGMAAVIGVPITFLILKLYVFVNGKE